MADPVKGRGWPQYSADDVLAAVSAAVEAERAWILALVDEAERVIHLEALDMDEARMTVVELRRAIEQETEG